MAAYCRVSTKARDQLDRLAAQEQYYEERIKTNLSCQFAGIYSDVGSGTTIKGQKRLNALISACGRGKVDMVLIKSASRFARYGGCPKNNLYASLLERGYLLLGR